jgi:predicted kinase
MAAGPAPTEPIPARVVVGCAGSGKTTLARALAVRLGGRHIERDAFGDDEAPWLRPPGRGRDWSGRLTVGAAPHVMATLRNLAIGVLSRARPVNLAAARRRHARDPHRPLITLGISLG